MKPETKQLIHALVQSVIYDEDVSKAMENIILQDIESNEPQQESAVAVKVGKPKWRHHTQTPKDGQVCLCWTNCQDYLGMVPGQYFIATWRGPHKDWTTAANGLVTAWIPLEEVLKQLSME